MKITLELEVGMETGIVAGALEAAIKDLKEAKTAGQDVNILLAVAERIDRTIEDAIFSRLRSPLPF